MRKTEHKTYTVQWPEKTGPVWVACPCGWREDIPTQGCTWAEGMSRIYAARDAHEAEFNKPALKAKKK